MPTSSSPHAAATRTVRRRRARVTAIPASTLCDWSPAPAGRDRRSVAHETSPSWLIGTPARREVELRRAPATGTSVPTAKSVHRAQHGHLLSTPNQPKAHLTGTVAYNPSSRRVAELSRPDGAGGPPI